MTPTDKIAFLHSHQIVCRSNIVAHTSTNIDAYASIAYDDIIYFNSSQKGLKFEFFCFLCVLYANMLDAARLARSVTFSPPHFFRLIQSRKGDGQYSLPTTAMSCRMSDVTR